MKKKPIESNARMIAIVLPLPLQGGFVKKESPYSRHCSEVPSGPVVGCSMPEEGPGAIPISKLYKKAPAGSLKPGDLVVVPGFENNKEFRVFLSSAITETAIRLQFFGDKSPSVALEDTTSVLVPATINNETE